MNKKIDYFKVQKDILKLAEQFGQVYEEYFDTTNTANMCIAQNASNVSNMLWDVYYALEYFTTN